MLTTKLSSKGQVIIPKWLREANHWHVGLEFVVVETEDGLLLKPVHPFPKSSIKDVAGCLAYDGPSKSIAEMDDAIQQGIVESWHDRG